jgi:hypothetical protein
MTWVAVLLGIVLTAFGATAGAALITVSRAELTRAVGRRLRGAAPSLSGLAQIDYYLTAAYCCSAARYQACWPAPVLRGSSLPLPCSQCRWSCSPPTSFPDG